MYEVQVDDFKPTQFVSSRSNRANTINKDEKQIFNRDPTAFMDEEDGLLNGRLSTKKGADSFMTSSNKVYNNTSFESSVFIPSEILVQPSVLSIGKLILNRMGWKEGQGVGSRVKLKKYNDNISGSIDLNKLHPGANLAVIPEGARSDNDVVTFAPRDSALEIKIPQQKNDYYCVGYDYYTNNPEISDYFSNYDVFMNENKSSLSKYHTDDISDKKSQKKFDKNNDNKLSKFGEKKGKDFKRNSSHISGFTYEDDDDDMIVYDSVDIDEEMTNTISKKGLKINKNKYSKTSYEIDLDDQNDDHNQSKAIESWINDSNMVTNDSFERCPSDGKIPLEGYTLGAATTQSTVIHYQLPAIPHGFILYHIFTDIPDKKDIDHINNSPILIPENDKNNRTKPSRFSALNTSSADNRPMLTSQALLETKFAGLSEAFKNRFQSSSQPSVNANNNNNNNKNDNNIIKEGYATAAEYSEKLNEIKANQLLSTIDNLNNNRNISKVIFKPKRVTTLWTPASLLCKRFKIIMPDHAKQDHHAQENSSNTNNDNRNDPLLNKVFHGSNTTNINNNNENSNFNNLNNFHFPENNKIGTNVDHRKINDIIYDEDIYEKIDKTLNKQSVVDFYSSDVNNDNSNTMEIETSSHHYVPVFISKKKLMNDDLSTVNNTNTSNNKIPSLIGKRKPFGGIHRNIALQGR
eukprot:gene16309-22217_t